MPKPSGCNLWAGPPSDDFLCDSRYCVPAPYFPRVQWPENETSYFPPVEGYFNLNPNAFGLSYEIFEVHEIVTKIHGKKTTITTGNWVSQTDLTHWPPEPTSTTTTLKNYGRGVPSHHLAKRDDTIAPAVCYDICNTAFLEGQRVGPKPELCEDSSPFLEYSNSCQECIAANKADLKLTLREYVGPAFEVFWGYCDIQPPQSQVSTTDLPPQTQVTNTPTVQTSTQQPPNTSTEPEPVTTTSTSTTTSSAEPEPSTSTSDQPQPSSTSTSSPPETTSSSSTPSPTSTASTGGSGPSSGSSQQIPSSSQTGGGGAGSGTPSSSSNPSRTTTPPGTGTSGGGGTSATGRPPTSSIATAAAGRGFQVPGVSAVGNWVAVLLSVVFFL
jgi:hypothetical protein